MNVPTSAEMDLAPGEKACVCGSIEQAEAASCGACGRDFSPEGQAQRLPGEKIPIGTRERYVPDTVRFMRIKGKAGKPDWGVLTYSGQGKSAVAKLFPMHSTWAYRHYIRRTALLCGGTEPPRALDVLAREYRSWPMPKQLTRKRVAGVDGRGEWEICSIVPAAPPRDPLDEAGREAQQAKWKDFLARQKRRWQ